LHLASILEKQNGQNITKLIVDDNDFTSKAGEYIGEALAGNPTYPIKKLSFKNINLEMIGLTRVIEACNLNTNVKRLHIGVLTDEGLQALATLLASNESLEQLTFEETKDHQKYWTTAGKAALVSMLKNGTKLMDVEMSFTRDKTSEDEEFVNEITFYTGIKSQKQNKMEDYRNILRSCDPAQMFGNLQ